MRVTGQKLIDLVAGRSDTEQEAHTGDTGRKLPCLPGQDADGKWNMTTLARRYGFRCPEENPGRDCENLWRDKAVDRQTAETRRGKNIQETGSALPGALVHDQQHPFFLSWKARKRRCAAVPFFHALVHGRVKFQAVGVDHIASANKKKEEKILAGNSKKGQKAKNLYDEEVSR